MDQIRISNLEVFCHHGVFEEENVLGQKFMVSVVIYADMSAAAKEDDLTKAINYSEVCHFIKKEMETKNYKLIEALTETLARKLLIQFTMIQKVAIEVKKPWAPILLPIETVSVVMEREWHKVYLSIGSNMGDKQENLNTAIDMLRADELCKVTKVSSFIVTEPVGGVVQEDFLNGALEIKTLRSPEELLDLIKQIESQLKRVRVVHWGPRTIDLDILFYDDKVIHRDNLIIPHKELQNRGFVLQPMSEIAPQMRHPYIGKTIYQMYQDVKDSSESLVR